MNLWRLNVLKNAQNRCEMGGMGVLQAHHIFHRANYPQLRYNPLNGACLSQGQHFKAHNQGEAELVGTLIKKRGQKWYDDLILTKIEGSGIQYTVEMLERIKSELENGISN